MKRFTFLLLATLLHAGGTKPSSAASPCWERDAQPILKRNCIGCHGPGSAMGNFSTPDSAGAHSNLILQNLSTGRMPMRGDLAAGDRATLIVWASQGAPRCP